MNKYHLTNPTMADLEADLAACNLLAEDETNELQWTVGSGTRWERYTPGEYDAQGNVITAPEYIEAAANVKLREDDERNALLTGALANGSTLVEPASPDRVWAE